MPDPDLVAARAAWCELGKALDTAEFAAPENDDWRHRVAVAMATLHRALQPGNELPLASSVRDVLAQWDRGALYQVVFEQKMREAICHFARVYLPCNEDLEHLTRVAKLAYQFKFRMQAVFIGGAKIQPFWDAIDDLPSQLLNEAHRELKEEEEGDALHRT